MPREQLGPLHGNNHPCMAVPGTGVWIVAVSSPNSSFQPPVAAGGGDKLPQGAKKCAVCQAGLAKIVMPLVLRLLNGQKL